MIEIRAHGGGIQWTCTECDTGEWGNLPTQLWTSGPAPAVCTRCDVSRSVRGFMGDITRYEAHQSDGRPDGIGGPRWRAICRQLVLEGV